MADRGRNDISPRSNSPGSPTQKRIRSKEADFSPKRGKVVDKDTSRQQRHVTITGEKVDFDSPKTIWITNLPHECPVEDLWAAFADFGQITACERGDSSTEGYVMFKKNVASKKAEEASGTLKVRGSVVSIKRMKLPVPNPPVNPHDANSPQSDGLVDFPAPTEQSRQRYARGRGNSTVFRGNTFGRASTGQSGLFGRMRTMDSNEDGFSQTHKSVGSIRNFGRMRTQDSNDDRKNAIREASFRSDRSGGSDRSQSSASRAYSEGIPAQGTPVVFVDNIKTGTDEEDFRAIFENNFGQILRINMQKDMVNYWSAYVEFAKMDSVSQATSASAAFDDILRQPDIGHMRISSSIKGQQQPRDSITSNRGRDSRSNKPKNATSGIYITRLSDDITEDKLYEAFGQFGRITDVFLIKDDKKNSRHSAFVDFLEPSSANRAVGRKSFEIDGRRVDVKFKHVSERPTNCFSVYVRNTPPATTESSIRAAFKHHGNIKQVQVLKDRSVAFVHYDSCDDVHRLVARGRVKLHGEEVVVRYNTRDPNTLENPGVRASRESSEEVRPLGCLKLYVSHLSTETTEESLTKVFSQFGALERVFILRELSTGVSKGVAFIDYKEPGSADKAMDAAASLTVDGRSPIIKYKVVEQQQKADGCSNTVFASNLAPETTEKTLQRHCEKYGDIESVHLLRDPQTGISRGKGFIMFKNSKSVDKAVKGSGSRIDGKVILFRCVQPAYTQNKREKPAGCVSIFISNLSRDSTEESIDKYFARFGQVANVSIVSSGPASRRVAFVTYQESDAVDKAVSQNGAEVDGHHVVIRYGDAKEPRGSKTLFSEPRCSKTLSSGRNSFDVSNLRFSQDMSQRGSMDLRNTFRERSYSEEPLRQTDVSPSKPRLSFASARLRIASSSPPPPEGERSRSREPPPRSPPVAHDRILIRNSKGELSEMSPPRPSLKFMSGRKNSTNGVKSSKHTSTKSNRFESDPLPDRHDEKNSSLPIKSRTSQEQLRPSQASTFPGLSDVENSPFLYEMQRLAEEKARSGDPSPLDPAVAAFQAIQAKYQADYAAAYAAAAAVAGMQPQGAGMMPSYPSPPMSYPTPPGMESAESNTTPSSMSGFAMSPGRGSRDIAPAYPDYSYGPPPATAYGYGYPPVSKYGAPYPQHTPSPARGHRHSFSSQTPPNPPYDPTGSGRGASSPPVPPPGFVYPPHPSDMYGGQHVNGWDVEKMFNQGTKHDQSSHSK